MKFVFITLIFIVFSYHLSAQKVDNSSDTVGLALDTFPKHSPKTATWLSVAVPGLGQAYNKKYWKIPVVYAAIGVPLYFALDQQSKFNDFKDAYLFRVDDNPNTEDDKYIGVYSDDQLLSLIDIHRRNRDLLFLLTGVAYALNILDAAVDAHLYYFEVSDDLSASLKPSFQFAPNTMFLVPSLTLSLKFGKRNHQNPF